MCWCESIMSDGAVASVQESVVVTVPVLETQAYGSVAAPTKLDQGPNSASTPSVPLNDLTWKK